MPLVPLLWSLASPATAAENPPLQAEVAELYARVQRGEAAAAIAALEARFLTQKPDPWAHLIYGAALRQRGDWHRARIHLCLAALSPGLADLASLEEARIPERAPCVPTAADGGALAAEASPWLLAARTDAALNDLEVWVLPDERPQPPAEVVVLRFPERTREPLRPDTQNLYLRSAFLGVETDEPAAPAAPVGAKRRRGARSR